VLPLLSHRLFPNSSEPCGSPVTQYWVIFSFTQGILPDFSSPLWAREAPQRPFLEKLCSLILAKPLQNPTCDYGSPIK